MPTLRTISCVEGRSQSVEKAAAWPAIILMLNRSSMSPAFNWATVLVTGPFGIFSIRKRLFSSCHEHMAGSSWLDAKALFDFDSSTEVCGDMSSHSSDIFHMLFLPGQQPPTAGQNILTYFWNWMTEIFFQVFRVGLGVWANSMNKSTGRTQMSTKELISPHMVKYTYSI